MLALVEDSRSRYRGPLPPPTEAREAKTVRRPVRRTLGEVGSLGEAACDRILRLRRYCLQRVNSYWQDP